MNIQYQRNLKNSYMIVIEARQPLNMDGQLAEKMIQRQQIPGLLYWVTMEHQGDITFWYQITGLQSLSDWLQHHPLNFELLGHLLSGLMALQQELPRFYLKCEHLLLQTEQIFLKPSGDGVVFCYEPLWYKEPRESLGVLLESLLPLIDHNDKEAVRLGYGLFEKCQEENADIWEYMMQQSFRETINKSDTDDLKDTEETIKQPAAENIRAESEMNPIYREEQSKEGLRSWFASKYMPVKFPDWTTLFPLSHKKKDVSSTSYYFEPEEEEKETEHPTVLLGKNETAEGKLVYRGTGMEENLKIEGDTFLVGSRNRQADANLQAFGISRNHARITMEKEAYYIEDLNSRNGTYLNGELLAYKQKYRIHPGDRLRFASEEYVFY